MLIRFFEVKVRDKVNQMVEMCFFLSHLTRCSMYWILKKVSELSVHMKSCSHLCLWSAFAFMNDEFLPVVYLLTPGHAQIWNELETCVIYFTWKKFVRFKDLCSRQGDTAVLADIFHPLTLINLLTKKKERKKEHGWNVWKVVAALIRFILFLL